MSTTYETDFFAWINEQAALLKTGRVEQLDVENLAEEIEALGRSEKRELGNRLTVLLAHLLKWQHQPERRGNSWLRTILEQRRRIDKLLKDSPSLRGRLSDATWLQEAWDDAREDAHSETGMGASFPDQCPWLIEDVLRKDWLPS